MTLLHGKGQEAANNTDAVFSLDVHRKGQVFTFILFAKHETQVVRGWEINSDHRHPVRVNAENRLTISTSFLQDEITIDHLYLHVHPVSSNDESSNCSRGKWCAAEERTNLRAVLIGWATSCLSRNCQWMARRSFYSSRGIQLEQKQNREREKEKVKASDRCSSFFASHKSLSNNSDHFNCRLNTFLFTIIITDKY